MVGASDQLMHSLISTYSSVRKSLFEALSRSASGRKIDKPSDDFVGFARASGLERTNDDYAKLKADLLEAQTYGKKGIEVGSAVYEDLAELKRVAEKYNIAASSGDTVEQRALASEFVALRKALVNTINNNRDVYTVHNTASGITTIDLDIDAGTNKLFVRFATNSSQLVLTTAVTNLTATGATGPTATATGDLLGGTNGAKYPYSFDATELAAIERQMARATRFLVSAEKLDEGIDLQIGVAGQIQAINRDVVDQITKLDDAEAIQQVIEASIRHEAAVSMLAQANMSRQVLASLFAHS